MVRTLIPLLIALALPSWGAIAHSGSSAYSASSPTQTTTISGGTLSSGATTVTVASGSGFSVGDYVVIDIEVIHCTAGCTGTSWTIARAQNGTTATSHSSGTTITRLSITSIALTVTPPATGNFLYIAGLAQCSGTTQTLSVSDTAGNTWTQINALNRLSNATYGTVCVQSWGAIANGNTSTTITMSGTLGDGYMEILYDPFSGTATSAFVDKTASSTSTTGTCSTTAQSLTTTGELVLGSGAGDFTAVGSGFTQGANDSNGDMTEYKLGQSGSQGTTWTNGTAANACIMSAILPYVAPTNVTMPPAIR